MLTCEVLGLLGGDVKLLLSVLLLIQLTASTEGTKLTEKFTMLMLSFWRYLKSKYAINFRKMFIIQTTCNLLENLDNWEILFWLWMGILIYFNIICVYDSIYVYISTTLKEEWGWKSTFFFSDSKPCITSWTQRCQTVHFLSRVPASAMPSNCCELGKHSGYWYWIFLTFVSRWWINSAPRLFQLTVRADLTHFSLQGEEPDPGRTANRRKKNELKVKLVCLYFSSVRHPRNSGKLTFLI